MFDIVSTSVKVGGGPAVVRHEHAPTAAHMRLLDEFRSKALDSVLAEYPVDCNGIRGKLVVLREHPLARVEARLLVEVNGTRNQYHVTIPEQVAHGDPEVFWRDLQGQLSKLFVVTVLRSIKLDRDNSTGLPDVCHRNQAAQPETGAAPHV